MSARELTRFAIGGLWRQKVRTALTLVGVTVGTCALAFSLSLGIGLRAFIDKEFTGRDEFWRVIVHPKDSPNDSKDVPPEKVTVHGNISDERKERIKEALVERYLATRPRRGPNALTPERLKAIGELPDVVEVRTFRSGEARVTAEGAPKPATGTVTMGALGDLQTRLLSGRLPRDGANEVVVSEMVLYDLGFRDDADLERLLDLPLRLEVGGVRNAPPLALALALTGRRPIEEITVAQRAVLEKLVTALPRKLDAFDLTPAERAELMRFLDAKRNPDEERPWDATATGTFRICGVVRLLNKEDQKKAGPLVNSELKHANLFLTAGTGLALTQQLPGAKNEFVFRADVRVRPGSNLQATVDAIEAMGFGTVSGAKWLASAKREVTLIAVGLNLFALIAIFVAGIGITNTLVTSVIERTKEIGIMRAVGATRASSWPRARSSACSGASSGLGWPAGWRSPRTPGFSTSCRCRWKRRRC
jgi:putative ABC transport system permease protein